MRDIAERRRWISRQATKGRLVADNVAEGGRDADRAARISADRERTDAREYCDRAAANTATGGPLEIPGVACNPAQR